jgi:hypothetical protein
VIGMRRLIAIVGPLAAAVVLLGTVSAVARSHGMDESVPNGALQPYQQMAAAFRHSAPAGYGAITDKFGISCIADPAGSGAMGVHYLNGNLLFDGQIEPSHPEAFVYAPGRNGGQQLVALEYIVIADVWDATHDGAPELFPGHPFMETLAGNRFDLPRFYSQHVWIGRHNPLGNLAMWNPRVHCPS